MDFEGLADEFPISVSDLEAIARVHSRRDGKRFLIGPDGRPDLRIEAFLRSPRFGVLRPKSSSSYLYSIVVWLNFLHQLGTDWSRATEDDTEEFIFWRLTDPENGERVATNTYARDMAALKMFYKWMAPRYGVLDVWEDVMPPVAVRQENVKWLDAAGYARWRDLGIRGRDLTGRPDRWWRGRNEQRDVAFCDGLYGNGLRLSEWASVVLPELPAFDRRRGYYTLLLADACAKLGLGHKYWLPQAQLKTVLSYVEGARAAAVRRAQAAGRYERLDGVRLVTRTDVLSVTMTGSRGGTKKRLWNEVGPQTRLKLFQSTPQGLEPLALWLNEDGLPRDGRGWEHTFETANERIATLGLEHFTCDAHQLRHSFALKWYLIGKLVFTSRLGHLSERERDDFREQFGDTWHLVQTLLGHRRVETTKNVYLEPFRVLDVEWMLEHVEGIPVAGFLAAAFADHPRVRTDPLAAAR